MVRLISTGILGLDDLLGGGIASGTITDIFGPGGSGKTQLVMQISLNSLQDGTVLYLDATGGFRPERMLQLIRLQNLEPSLLDDVIVARMTNTAEQLEYVKKISEMKPNLVVIENITDLFAFEYSKEANLLEKHVRFMEYMHELSLTAISTKIPVVVTNMVRSIDGIEIENLNKSISMFTHKKIKLEKDGKVFKAQVFPSFGKRKEILYTITEAGLMQVSTP
ncbi:ATPase domain-containing protein [Candidatus Nitrosotalea okcheonensis]|uniref:Rad51 n=1 Tax=Candidatus Nitrosotalea okcheonensis TaxID=1903276 RepID=A0A2H1FHE8_9ARCH|nr:ATPase domain-containing protein [Candidatus Nitrosotalea okcheonensis]SMH72196.1 Rad51 [Candidatus Nitrosotalea okcheonensis]